jgi:serine/threonine protein kinase
MAHADDGPDETPTLPPRVSDAAACDQSATTPPTRAGEGPGPGSEPLPRPFGRYRLDYRLGDGGMGTVYLAHDTQLGRIVALKIPALGGTAPGQIRARFLREARAAAALSHPNICPLYDVGEVGGVPYLTMAFIRGEPLARRLEPGRASAPPEAPPRAAVALVRAVALALQYAHERHVIHRDLKPANIMIDERGEPVVMDFGLARLDEATPLTRTAGVCWPPFTSVLASVARLLPSCWKGTARRPRVKLDDADLERETPYCARCCAPRSHSTHCLSGSCPCCWHPYCLLLSWPCRPEGAATA